LKREYQIDSGNLSNGLQICAVRCPGKKAVSIRCFVFTGSAYENKDNNGISHFLEHMLFRGNLKLGDSNTLNLKMEALGGELNAVTSFDLSEIWLNFHIDYFDIGIERFCQFMQFPQFEQIEIERSIILEEIRADYGENDQLIDLDNLVARELWDGHPMSYPVTGCNLSVKTILKSHVTDWFHRFYQPGNMIIGITADVEPKASISAVSRQFTANHRSARKKYPLINNSGNRGKQIQMVYQKDNQFNLLWTFPAYPLTSELRIQYQLIRRILDDGSSSRLQQLVREERGLVYDISAEMLYFRSGATLNIQSQVSVGRFPELLKVLVALVKELSESGFTQQELDLAKLRYQMALDFNGDIPHGALYNEIGPDIHPYVSTFEQTRKLINLVPLPEINLTLANLLSQNGTYFALVGPCNDEHKRLLEGKLGEWTL